MKPPGPKNFHSRFSLNNSTHATSFKTVPRKDTEAEKSSQLTLQQCEPTKLSSRRRRSQPESITDGGLFGGGEQTLENSIDQTRSVDLSKLRGRGKLLSQIQQVKHSRASAQNFLQLPKLDEVKKYGSLQNITSLNSQASKRKIPTFKKIDWSKQAKSKYKDCFTECDSSDQIKKGA